MTSALVQKCFAPTVWLSGQLTYSRKFMLIGIVVLVALGILGEPLLRTSLRNGELVQNERQGLTHLTAQADMLTRLVQQRSQTALPDSSAQTVRAVIEANSMTELLDQAKASGLSEQTTRLAQAWQQARNLGPDQDPQHGFTAYTGAINALLGLMRETARVHRLNVDHQLDATFDMLANRLPLVLETLAKQRDALALDSMGMASYAFGAQVVLTESVPGLKTGIAQLAQDNPNGRHLDAALEHFLAQVAAQQDAADKALVDPAAIGELSALATGNLALADALLKDVIRTSDRQLETRSQQLQHYQVLISALLLTAICALFYLFAGIYLSTLRSLKSLADGTEAFCAGKLDTRIRIDTRDELVLVARNFNTVASEFSRLLDLVREQNESRQRELEEMVLARTRELAEKNDELQASNARVKEEVELARNMQLAILPQHFPDETGWAVAAVMNPAREMGGDFYDCFQLPDGRYGVLVADVSGKGVAAAFFMAVSRTVLLDLALHGGDPGQVLAKANDALCDRNPMELFVTVFYAIYNPADGHLSYACAGHNPPLLRQLDGQVSTLHSPHDLALGILPDMGYSTLQASLAHGATLVMFTDGVTEAFSARGEAFGDERLHDWLSQTSTRDSAADLVASLVRSVSEFVDGAEASDDLTCLVLSRKLEPTLMIHSMPSRLDEIPRLADRVDFALADRPDLAFTVNLCLEELITNTILHGLQGAPNHEIDVRIADKEGWLEVRIRDDAPPFDPFSEAPPPDLVTDIDERAIGGLGVHLVRNMMDDTHAAHDGHGNLIVLRKRLN